MKIKNIVTLLSLSFVVSTQLAIASVSPLVDVNYQFDQTKVNASEDTFHFLRSFVDYFYDLVAQNPNGLHIVKAASGFNGWCVGDAHAENFGILLQENGSALFTNNDMDDSGPCPVAIDLLRILVSSRLYMPGLVIKDVINSYQDGLKGKSASVPDIIQSMTKDALRKGIPAKAKELQGNSFIRKDGMEEVDSVTKGKISTLLQNQYRAENLKVLDLVATSKIGGGSGGLLRFEVLITNKTNQLIHLELKTLVAPSIYPVATAAIPDQLTRMQRTLQMDQGSTFSHYYNVFNINGVSMLLRPKFAGNLGVNLADSSDQENIKIINFEAYILGRLHAGSINVKDYSNAIDSMSSDKWEADISSMSTVFTNKFNQLKK